MDKDILLKYISSIKNNNDDESPFLSWLKLSAASIYEKNSNKDLLGYLFLGYEFSNDATKKLLNNVAKRKTLLNKICHHYEHDTLLTELSNSLLAKPFKSYMMTQQKDDFTNSQIMNMHQFLDHYSYEYPREKKTVFLRNIHNFVALGALTFFHLKPELAIIATPLHIFFGMSVGTSIGKMATQGRYYGIVESYKKIFTHNQNKKFEFKNFSMLTEQIHDYIFSYHAFKLMGSLYKKNNLNNKLEEQNDKKEMPNQEKIRDIFLSLCENQFLHNITSNDKQSHDAINALSTNKKNKTHKI